MLVVYDDPRRVHRSVVDLAETYAEPARRAVLVSFDGLGREHDRSRGRTVTFERARDRAAARRAAKAPACAWR